MVAQRRGCPRCGAQKAWGHSKVGRRGRVRMRGTGLRVYGWAIRRAGPKLLAYCPDPHHAPRPAR